MNYACLQGYNCVANLCRTQHIKGGIAIFVKRGTAFQVRSLDCCTNLIREIDFEAAAVEFDGATCVLVVYRSPKGKLKIFTKNLTEILNKIALKYKNIILCGDINVDWLNSDHRDAKTLRDLFCSYRLLSLIQKPTRVTKQSRKAIDYLVTNIGNNTSWDVLEFPASDHTAQMFRWNAKSPCTVNDKACNVVFRRAVAWCNLEEFRYRFNREILDLSAHTGDINLMFDAFLRHFAYCFEVACPLVRARQVAGDKICFRYSADLQQSYDELRLFGYMSRVTDDENVRGVFNALKRKFNQRVYNDKRNYYSNIIMNADNKNKKLWQIVRTKTGHGDKMGRRISLQIDGTVVSDDKAVAESFGAHFTGVVRNKIDQLYGHIDSGNNCTTVSLVNSSMFLWPVSEREISNIIMKLKNASPGLDGVPVKVLKHCHSEISQYIADILNKAIAQGVFPDGLKTSLVVPVFKRGDRSNVDNYRQITLVSAFSKIFERAVYDRVVGFLESRGLLTTCQHGFRKGRSTETATAAFVQHIADEVDRNKLVVGVFFDLSQAFDTINLSHLAEKLYYVGIRGPVNRFLVSFASERRMMVRVGGSMSRQYEVDVGAPQGSVLGPLLFLLYVNDLPDYIDNAKVFMYADDTSVVVSALDRSQLESVVSRVIGQFGRWCEQNGLIVNCCKTVAVEFSGMYMVPIGDLQFTMKGENIPMVDKVTFLGIELDSKVNWNNQISKICGRLGSAYYAILNIKNIVSEKALIQVYYSVVQSVLTYGIIVWGQAAELRRVFVLQKRIIRMMFGMHRLESCREVFKAKKVMTVVSLYLYRLLTYTYTHKSNYTLNGEVHHHDTRTAGSIRLRQIFHLNQKKTPRYAGSSMYNKLPTEWRGLLPAEFKRKVKQALQDNVFYTIAEFEAYLQSL